MTDALVNDKPQFVRLFIENGLNILDYLTYGRLEELYRLISEGCLAYTLLQRYLTERQGAVNIGTSRVLGNLVDHTPSPVKQLTLYEVGVEEWVLLWLFFCDMVVYKVAFHINKCILAFRRVLCISFIFISFNY